MITVCTPTGDIELPENDRRIRTVHALEMAAEKIAKLDYTAQLAKHRKSRRRGAMRLEACAVLDAVVDMIPLVLSGEMDPEVAMATLMGNGDIKRARGLA